jgi:hypothetical protein
MHKERPAPDAGTLRLDQIEHELDRDRRIDRAAAGAKNLATGAGRERIGGGDHMALRRAGDFCDTPGGGFRGRRERLGA